MKLTEEQQQEFTALSEIMMEWLDRHCHPHCSISITSVRSELSEGCTAIVNKKYQKSDNDSHMRADCPILEASCDFYAYEYGQDGKLKMNYCKHRDNESLEERNCLHSACPLSKDKTQNLSSN